MALSRRTGARFQASIWPGFVDAMTGLLLVLMFVLTIFMVIQFVLRETITGQETQLSELSAEVAALADALGFEQDRSAALGSQVGLLSGELSELQQALAEREREVAQQNALIAQLTGERDQLTAALSDAETQITGFEAQVAGLLAERRDAIDAIASLEAREEELLTEQEALNLALAQARQEIDEGVEAARLAAARREALEAMVANLETEQAASAEAISELEAQRLVDAAAADALRERLENADAELTAMTLALEEQRQQAEDTLTLLAAAQAAQEDLDQNLAIALLAQQEAESALAELSQNQLTTAEQLAEAEAARETLDSNLALALLAQREAEALAERLNAERDDLAAQLAAEQAVTERNEARALDLQDQLAAALIARTELEADLAAAQSARQTLDADLSAAVAALAAAQVAASSAADASDAAQAEADRQAALLALANTALAEEEALSAESQRQVAVLSEQVAALRGELGRLQALLDLAGETDEAANVRIETLTQDLNAAMARALLAERRNNELEQQELERLAAEAAELERYRSDFLGSLREVLEGVEGVQIVGDRFVFSSEVLFEQGAAELSAEGQREIAKVAAILRQVAGDIPAGIDWVIRVDGHTDNVPLSGLGEFANNWELSQARALSVVLYMVNFLGIPPERLAANGFGQYQPINPADTDEARAQNRRIELKLTER